MLFCYIKLTVTIVDKFCIFTFVPYDIINYRYKMNL